MSKLKILKIDSNIYRRLKNIDKEDSIDRNLNKIINIVEKDMPKVNFSSETKSISLYPETIDLLDSFKISLGESRDTVLTRLMLMYDEMNNFAEAELIPFKLISTVNPKLKLTGGINENEVVPDVSLERKYKVGNENLTIEFRNWINLLDWEEIQSLVLSNPDEHKKYRRPNYILEINF